MQPERECWQARGEGSGKAQGLGGPRGKGLAPAGKFGELLAKEKGRGKHEEEIGWEGQAGPPYGEGGLSGSSRWKRG